MRSKEDLRPKLVERLVQAIEASGLDRAAYTERVRVNNENANALPRRSLRRTGQPHSPARGAGAGPSKPVGAPWRSSPRCTGWTRARSGARSQAQRRIDASALGCGRDQAGGTCQGGIRAVLSPGWDQGSALTGAGSGQCSHRGGIRAVLSPGRDQGSALTGAGSGQCSHRGGIRTAGCAAPRMSPGRAAPGLLLYFAAQRTPPSRSWYRDGCSRARTTGASRAEGGGWPLQRSRRRRPKAGGHSRKGPPTAPRPPTLAPARLGPGPARPRPDTLPCPARQDARPSVTSPPAARRCVLRSAGASRTVCRCCR